MKSRFKFQEQVLTVHFVRLLTFLKRDFFIALTFTREADISAFRTLCSFKALCSCNILLINTGCFFHHSIPIDVIFFSFLKYITVPRSTTNNINIFLKEKKKTILRYLRHNMQIYSGHDVMCTSDITCILAYLAHAHLPHIRATVFVLFHQDTREMHPLILL